MMLLVFWVVAGIGSFATHVSDSGPPEYRRQEALRAALLAPLVLADRTSACLANPEAAPMVGLGFLLSYGALTLLMLGCRSARTFRSSALLLASLTAAGLYGVVAVYLHPPM